MKKVCRKCKVFVTGSECPICHGNNFTTSWKGRIIILNPEKSEIAQKLEIKEKHEYAIKIS
ncbi:MAG: DNA-directed RNA polymerase subunit E'' [Nanoarchaeota archaeon]|nr:DNA-directed RNA polymerase subunit E'' [Nanoarchaeota archaeon]MBU0962294.1 DNA-directed RNA polymerase subunit E'' [Nanoarchaeota archaeon]